MEWPVGLQRTWTPRGEEWRMKYPPTGDDLG